MSEFRSDRIVNNENNLASPPFLVPIGQTAKNGFHIRNLQKKKKKNVGQKKRT